MAEVNVSTSGCNATNTYPMKCSALRIDGFVMLKSHPCKIENISTSKTGTEVHLTGIDIFSSQKYEDICHSTLYMNVPHVEEKYYTLIDIDDGYLSLMSDDGSMRDDLPLPETNLAGEITAEFINGTELICTATKACGKEAVTASRK